MRRGVSGDDMKYQHSSLFLLVQKAGIIILCVSLLSVAFTFWRDILAIGRCVALRCPNVITPLNGEAILLNREMKTNLTVGFVSDTSSEHISHDDSSFDKVLQRFKSRKIQLLVVSGDGGHGNFDSFFGRVDSVVGRDFPIMLGLGNHDGCVADMFANEINRRITSSGIDCYGKFGMQMVCGYEGFIGVFVNPAIGWCRDGVPSEHDEFLRSELPKFQNVHWKACIWHKPDRKFHLGKHNDNVGGSMLYDTCRRHGSMIINGHTHHYVRTHTISNFEGPEIVQSATTMNGKELLRLESGSEGRSFSVIVGTGKHFRERNQPDKPWMAKTVTASDTTASGGGLVCQFNLNGDPQLARCIFEDNNETIVDEFYIRSVVHEPPT